MSANMSESSGTGDAPSTAPHGRRSKVWEHFEQDLVFVGDVPKAICKYCAMKFTCNRKSGTSSLLSHISESCRLIGTETRSRFLATIKKKSTDVGFVFDRKRSRQLMTKFCIHAEIPFKKFDDPYFLDFFLEKYCENFDEVEKAMDAISLSVKLYYKLYEDKGKRSSEYSVSREARINVGSPVLGKRKLEEEFAQYKSRRRNNSQPKSEIDAYLEENFIESEDFEILTWWKSNAEKFPVLSAMARDFLAVPLSTVSSESAFSCGGRILGDTRASLKPHALEDLVCGKDWLLKVPSNEGAAVLADDSVASWRRFAKVFEEIGLAAEQ